MTAKGLDLEVLWIALRGVPDREAVFGQIAATAAALGATDASVSYGPVIHDEHFGRDEERWDVSFLPNEQRQFVGGSASSIAVACEMAFERWLAT